MIGPLPFWTTLRSSDNGTGSGFCAGAAAAVFDCACEKRVSASPLEAANAASPSSRRLSFGAGSALVLSDPQVPQPLEEQLPQPLAPVLITFNLCSMMDHSQGEGSYHPRRRAKGAAWRYAMSQRKTSFRL